MKNSWPPCVRSTVVASTTFERGCLRDFDDLGLGDEADQRSDLGRVGARHRGPIDRRLSVEAASFGRRDLACRKGHQQGSPRPVAIAWIDWGPGALLRRARLHAREARSIGPAAGRAAAWRHAKCSRQPRTHCQPHARLAYSARQRKDEPRNANAQGRRRSPRPAANACRLESKLTIVDNSGTMTP